MANNIYNLVATVQATAPSGQPFSFRLPSIQNQIVVGQAYSIQIQAIGGTGPFSYSKLSGSFPNAGTVSTGGLITFTPNAAGDFIAIVQGLDSLGTPCVRAISFRVVSGYGFVQFTPLPQTNGRAYAYQFIAQDLVGDRTGFTFTITSGAIPGADALSAAGLLSGTTAAGAEGNYRFRVHAAKAGLSVDADCTLVVNRAVSSILITPVWNPAIIGQEVSGGVTLPDDVGTRPLSFTATGLPPGVTINRVTGRFEGKATGPTTISFASPVITVTDFNGSSANISTLATPILQGVPTVGPGQFLVGDSNGNPTALDFFNLLYGAGIDGDFVLDGTNTYPLFFSKSGNVYSPLSHISANNLSIVSPGKLKVLSWCIDVNDTFDMSGCPAGSLYSEDGLDAVGRLAGNNVIQTQELGGSIGAYPGSVGVTAPGVPASPPNAANQPNAPGISGGGGGKGGNTAITGALPGQAATANPWSAGATKNPFDSLFFPASGPLTGGLAGAAGGAGGGTASVVGGAGGGSGGPPGVGQIRCRRFKTNGSTAAGAINFKGGKGGNGTNAPGTNAAGGGAGGGASGGRFRIIFNERIGAPVTNLIDVSGGDGGIGGTGNGTGTAGANGIGADSGIAEAICMGTATITYAPVVLKVGTSTAGAVNKMTL